MKILIILITAIILSNPLYAQDTLWSKTYLPGVSDGVDRVRSGCSTYDGNFVLGGYTLSYGLAYADFYLVKIDTDGDTVWTGTYGGTQSDYCEQVIELENKDLLAVGYCHVAHEMDYFAIRLVRTDSLGNQLWSRYYGQASDVKAYGAFETSSNQIVVVGNCGPSSNPDGFMLRVNADGDSLFMTTYGTTGYDYVRDVSGDGYGNFVVVGYADNDKDYNYDLWMTGLNSGGGVEWTYRDGGGGYDDLTRVIRTDDGNFLAGGCFNIYDSEVEQRMYLIKFDINGDTLWTTSFYPGNNTNVRGLCQTGDGGYLAVGNCIYGTTASDAFVVRLDNTGDSLWSQNYGGDAYDYAYFIKQSIDDYIYVGGTLSDNASPDFWAMKIEDLALGTELPHYLDLPDRVIISQNRPNPFNSGTRIDYFLPRQSYVKLKIYNILGQDVKTLISGPRPAGRNSVYWNGCDSKGNEVASGIYLYRMKTDNQYQTRKMIIMK